MIFVLRGCSVFFYSFFGFGEDWGFGELQFGFSFSLKKLFFIKHIDLWIRITGGETESNTCLHITDPHDRKAGLER